MSEKPQITFDFETRSYADLTKTGSWAYAEDPTTDVICAGYGIDYAPREVWWPTQFDKQADELGLTRKYKGDRMPEDLEDALFAGDGGLLEAHKADFEFAIWFNIMVKKYGWRELDIKQIRDTMAVACYYSLPAKLDRLARALGFEGKDQDGGKLITKYSKLHLKTAKSEIPAEDFGRWLQYVDRDVAVEQAVGDFLGDLPERELPIFQLNLAVGLRGMYLDLEGIENATAIVEQRSAELTAEFRELTGYNPTQRDRCMEWFASNGLELENMQGDYLGELLEDEGNPIPSGPVRRALEIRIKINRASTKKLDAMARQRGKNGRARFQTRYHGATTGRETASGFQALNLARGFEDVEPAQLVRDISYRDGRYLDMLYGDAMDAVSKASRHWIKAQKDHRILSGDFVSIEAVILACLAGEQWKVDAFTRKEKIYELMGDKIYNLAPGTVTKKTHPLERQDGKTGELAFGFKGALNAWLAFDSSGRHTDERIIEICKSWRAEHPMITKLWSEIELAAIKAVRNPGEEFGYRELAFQTVEDWLTMILPDGKRLWYWQPELRVGMPAWHQPKTKPECAAGDCSCTPRAQLTFMSQKFGKWLRVSTYGGKLTENATQGTARQCLFPSALRAEAEGYRVILTVYDEIVCEPRENFGSKNEFVQIMSECPGDFARGWPIGVDAWEGYVYKK